MRTYLVTLGVRVDDVDNDLEAGLFRCLIRARISQAQRVEEFKCCDSRRLITRVLCDSLKSLSNRAVLDQKKRRLFDASKARERSKPQGLDGRTLSVRTHCGHD